MYDCRTRARLAFQRLPKAVERIFGGATKPQQGGKHQDPRAPQARQKLAQPAGAGCPSTTTTTTLRSAGGAAQGLCLGDGPSPKLRRRVARALAERESGCGILVF